MFRKWLTETDEALAKLSSSQREFDQDDAYGDLPTSMNSSPTFYERNLNVWRQLWRTTEISEILLVLIGQSNFFENAALTETDTFISSQMFDSLSFTILLH